MENIQKLLKNYEKRHAPKTHRLSNSPRVHHWYRITLYSDGSGFVNDSCGATRDDLQVLFRFFSYKELVAQLKK